LSNRPFAYVKAARKHVDEIEYSPTFYEQLSIQSVLQIFSLLTIWLCNFLAKEYFNKSCISNVGEID